MIAMSSVSTFAAWAMMVKPENKIRKSK